MKRPNKIDYLISEKLDNRFAMFNYYNDLETYADELEKAIEVTRCCDKLKNKEKMTFEEWRKANKFKHIYGYYYKNDDKLNHEQVQQIYIEYLKNL